jgi:hypothetical protein
MPGAIHLIVMLTSILNKNYSGRQFGGYVILISGNRPQENRKENFRAS